MIGLLSLGIGTLSVSAFASTQINFDFNTPGEVAANFTEYVNSGTVGHTADGGLDNSGAISTPGHSEAVYTTKASYSMGPVGSSYEFVSYMHNQGGDGYSGMGFTGLEAASSNVGGNPYVPSDAVGVSVHGGGFVFHDGASKYEQLWTGTLSEPAITTVQAYTAGSGNLLGDGSPDQWYKVIFIAERVSATKLDTRLEVWPCNSSGTLLNGSASAVFEFNNRDATGLLSSSSIMSYFSFSGDRIHNFDNFSVNLDGGVSVIAEDAPVVITDGASEAAGSIAADGDVTDAGGSAIVERGFVYSTEAEPTIADEVLLVSGTTGDFSGTTNVLPNDTYHVRAYATNSAGTSYGAEFEVTIANGTSDGDGDGSGSSDSGDDESGTTTTVLAITGFDPLVPIGIGSALLVAGYLLYRRQNFR